MTTALGIAQGEFGRVALLDMNTSLVGHAHPHCHVLMKLAGPDRDFVVREQEYPVRDDTAVLMNSWEHHRYDHPEGAPRTLYLALYIEPAWIAEQERRFAPGGEVSLFAQPSARLTAPMRDMRRRLAEHLADGAQDKVAEITGALILEMLHANADAPSPRAEPRGPDWRIRRVLRTMRRDPAADFDFDDLAREAGLSRAHFNDLFRACTGTTPAIYGNALRVERAVNRLAARDAPIAAVADELAFSAQSNFTRFFQQRTGITPSHYRRVVQTTEE